MNPVLISAPHRAVASKGRMRSRFTTTLSHLAGSAWPEAWWPAAGTKLRFQRNTQGQGAVRRRPRVDFRSRIGRRRRRPIKTLMPGPRESSSLKEVVSAFAIISSVFQTALLESDGPNRTGTGRFGQVFPEDPYRHARPGDQS